MAHSGIEFFHPGLGSIRCILFAPGHNDGDPVRLIGATLEAGGDVRLQLANDGGESMSDSAPLSGVSEQPDGALLLEFADGNSLSVPSVHAARARDVVLSLANRITAYF